MGIEQLHQLPTCAYVLRPFDTAKKAQETTEETRARLDNKKQAEAARRQGMVAKNLAMKMNFLPTLSQNVLQRRAKTNVKQGWTKRQRDYLLI